MRKYMKRVLSLFLSAVMALSVAGVAFAEDPSVTFDNLREPQPDLYVSKTVISAMDGYTVPDTEFTFVLKWDQDGDGYLEFADNVAYFLYDKTGAQVKNENTSDGSFRTSSTGQFTLKDGQYVRFEFAGEVEYEITELTAQGFTQTAPAGGEPATGTVPADGVEVAFENTYVPDTESETTMLAIRKDIAYPSGYELPGDFNDEFTFEVKIDGELYINAAYTVYDADTREELSRGTTDSAGRLTIRAGQVALFEDVEVGLDYEVKEVTDDLNSWQIVGDTEYHGSTSAPLILAYFTNEPASWFTVTKERSDGAEGQDDLFTFTLTGEGEAPLSGVLYYIYDENGKLVGSQDAADSGETPVPGSTDEPETATSYAHHTDAAGQLTLKADQTALFVGLAAGTGYTLTENVSGSRYVIYEIDKNGTTAGSSSGSVSGTVSTNGDAYTFINEETTEITIQKYDAAKNNLLGGAGFTLYKLNDGYTEDSTEEGAWEKVGDEKFTDAQKEINGEPNESYGTLTFTGLTAGTYKIVETTTPAGYVALDQPIIVKLPYTVDMDTAESEHLDTSGFIWSERDGVYYVYDLTYDVTNEAVLTLPNTGSFPWTWVIIGAAAVVLAGGAVLVTRYAKKNSTGKRMAV